MELNCQYFLKTALPDLFLFLENSQWYVFTCLLSIIHVKLSHTLLQTLNWYFDPINIFAFLLGFQSLKIQQIQNLFHITLYLNHRPLGIGVVRSIRLWKTVFIVIPQSRSQLLCLPFQLIDLILHIFVELIYLFELILHPSRDVRTG